MRGGAMCTQVRAHRHAAAAATHTHADSANKQPTLYIINNRHTSPWRTIPHRSGGDPRGTRKVPHLYAIAPHHCAAQQPQQAHFLASTLSQAATHMHTQAAHIACLSAATQPHLAAAPLTNTSANKQHQHALHRAANMQCHKLHGGHAPAAAQAAHQAAWRTPQPPLPQRRRLPHTAAGSIRQPKAVGSSPRVPHAVARQHTASWRNVCCLRRLWRRKVPQHQTAAGGDSAQLLAAPSLPPACAGHHSVHAHPLLAASAQAPSIMHMKTGAQRLQAQHSCSPNPASTIGDATCSTSRPPGLCSLRNSLVSAAARCSCTSSALQHTQATIGLSASAHQRAGGGKQGSGAAAQQSFRNPQCHELAAASTSCTKHAAAASKRRLALTNKRHMLSAGASQEAAAAREPAAQHASAAKLSGSIWPHLAAAHIRSANHNPPATTCMPMLLRHQRFPEAACWQKKGAPAAQHGGGRSCRPAFTAVCQRRFLLLHVPGTSKQQCVGILWGQAAGLCNLIYPPQASIRQETCLLAANPVSFTNRAGSG